MVVVRPSKHSPIASGSLVKQPDEHPYDYVRKIQFHCSYRSDVKGEKQFDLPDRVSAMIIHCLPDQDPYIAVKQKFSDIYLPNNIPNYDRYRNAMGQWSLSGQYFWKYLERVEREYFIRNNLPLPYYYNPHAPIPYEVVFDTSSSYHPMSGNGSRGDKASSSSCQVISNPDPPPTPSIIILSSDSESEEEDPMEDEDDEDDDPNF